MDMSELLAHHSDLSILDTPPTRGDRKLDLIITNAVTQDTKQRLYDPLVSSCGTPSDHKTVFCSTTLKRREVSFKVEFYHRPVTK